MPKRKNKIITYTGFSGKNNFNETLPVISVYIIAGYKLLPIFPIQASRVVL